MLPKQIVVLCWYREGVLEKVSRKRRLEESSGGMEEARAKALWFECCVPREMRTG